MPKLASEHKSYLEEFGLNDELVKLLVKQRKVSEFEYLVKVLDNPNLVGKMLTVFFREIVKKSGKSVEEVEKVLNQDLLERVLESVGDGKISESDVKVVLGKVFSGMSLGEAMEKSDVDLAGEVARLVKEKPGLSQGAYMGLVMGKFKGKVSGGEVAKVLSEVLK